MEKFKAGLFGEDFESRQPAPTDGWMRAFGITGRLLSHFRPGMDLSVQLLNLEGPEYLFLRRTLQFSGAAVIPAGAGNSIGELVNPAGSGLIAVARLTVWNSGAVGSVGWQCAPGALAYAPLSAWNVDSRQPVGGALQALPGLVLATQNGAAPGAPLQRVQLSGNAVYEIPGPFVIVPGSKLLWGHATAAQALSFHVEWTERKQLPSEE